MAATPGPWTVEDYALDDEASWFFHHTIEDADGDFICHTSYTRVWGGKDEHEEANARLIAAAPDLLAALEGLYDLAYPSDDHDHALMNALSLARAALAAAHQAP